MLVVEGDCPLASPLTPFRMSIVPEQLAALTLAMRDRWRCEGDGAKRRKDMGPTTWCRKHRATGATGRAAGRSAGVAITQCATSALFGTPLVLASSEAQQAVASARPEWFQSTEDSQLDAATAAAALAALDDDLRETVTAHLWGGLTFEQIAGLTGVTSSTAHRRYKQGLEQLRTRLERTCRTRTPNAGPASP